MQDASVSLYQISQVIKEACAREFLIDKKNGTSVTLSSIDFDNLSLLTYIIYDFASFFRAKIFKKAWMGAGRWQ